MYTGVTGISASRSTSTVLDKENETDNDKTIKI